MGVSQLDSVIIAPSRSLEGDSQILDDLQPAWEELEALVRNQQIAAIGTSDLDKDLLEQLYNWADVSPEHQREGATTEKGRIPPFSPLTCEKKSKKNAGTETALEYVYFWEKAGVNFSAKGFSGGNCFPGKDPGSSALPLCGSVCASTFL